MRVNTSGIFIFIFVSIFNCVAADRARLGISSVVDDTSSPSESSQESKAVASHDGIGKKMSSSGFWTNPVTLGLLLGLLLIGPDHLGTLIALSTLATGGIASFKVGFAWGFGHSLGMLLICPIFMLLKKMTNETIKKRTENWEYYGDYCIGASMVLMAVYFICFESSYLQKEKDGTYVAKECSCHSSAKDHEAHDTHADGPDEEGAPHRSISCRIKSHKFCESYQANFRQAAGRLPDPEEEKMPLLQKTEAATGIRAIRNCFSWRDAQGAMLGVLQGLCWPMGLIGVGFMGRMSMTSSPLVVIIFAAVFVLASAIASGAITLGWGAMTRLGSASCISPRTMYRASCIGTFILGAVWIAANFYGVLDHINFGDKISSRIQEKILAEGGQKAS